MSSFSSVIRKPGAKPAPKVAPRRNVIRKPAQSATSVQPQVEAAASEGEGEGGAPGEILSAAALPQINDNEQATSQPRPKGVVSTEPLRQAEDETDSAAVTSTKPPAPASVDTNGEQGLQKSAPQRQSETSQVSEAERSTPSQTPLPPRSPRRQRRPQPQQHPTERPAPVVETRSEEPTTEEAVAAEPEDTVRVSSTTPAPRARRNATRSSSRTSARPQLATPPPTQPSPASTQPRAGSPFSQRGASVTSQRSEAQEALDRVNSQFRRVGDIAASIIRDTPATESSVEGDGERPRKRRRRNNATEQAAEVVSAAGEGSSTPQRKRTRQRGPTPEDAEEHVLEPEKTTLFDLCDDKHKWGKKSAIEKEMAANWSEILARRREDANERFEKAQQGRRKKDKLSIPDQPVGEGDMGAVPELVIENGQLVVASRDVDRHADTTNIANAVADADIREDTDIYKRINSATVGPQRGHIAPGQYWDDLSTEMFYSGLKMFGTDFKMISNMIPGKNRKQVKLKYNVEERQNWAKVRRCLDQKEEVSLDNYANMTGITFGSVADVYKQMEEDEKKLREEDETRRREEGIISRNPAEQPEADVPVPSIEGQEAEGEGEDASTTTASRLGSTTTSVRQATAGKKGKGATKKGRQTAKNKQTFEGVEERLGDVTEIGIPGS